MFMFGMRCVRCNHEIIAPHKTEFLDDKDHSSSLALPLLQGSIRIFSAISKERAASKRSNDQG